MFSERLDKLIQSSLQDGILTDQEKAVILKRAKAEGEDIDEVEIYIDSLLQKRQKELSSKSSISGKSSSVSIMNEELKKLIDIALTDGVLTSKEREVILKKAISLGIDEAEVDMYLDAELQKIDQANDAAVRRQKGKQCPYCGAPIPQLADKCPECGQFVTPEATKELEEIFDNLEEALVNMKSSKDFDRNKAIVERYERKAMMYYSNHPKIKVLLAEVDAEMIIAEKKAKSLQRSESVKSFFTNPWTYGALFIILTILVIVFFIYMTNKTAHEEGEDSAIWWGFGIFYIGVPCIIGTVSFINKVCLKKH